MMKPTVTVTEDSYDALMDLLFAATTLLQEHDGCLTVPLRAIGDMSYFMDRVAHAGRIVEAEQEELREASQSKLAQEDGAEAFVFEDDEPDDRPYPDVNLAFDEAFLHLQAQQLGEGSTARLDNPWLN